MRMTEELRERALRMYANGLKVSEIARILGVTYMQAYYAVNEEFREKQKERMKARYQNVSRKRKFYNSLLRMRNTVVEYFGRDTWFSVKELLLKNIDMLPDDLKGVVNEV